MTKAVNFSWQSKVANFWNLRI